ncbi:nitroreductase family protein [Patulibacter minatonensis]|uniref:nitroreductase family protein n=1 Tax=Patulibacter minatonensis TaxID=298163 RepID=UPI0004B0C51E|nr:nitroreductase family protein [Patulibacter minatonensis]
MSTEIIDGPESEALGSDGIAVALAQQSRLTVDDLRRTPRTVDAPAPWRTTGTRVALPGAPSGVATSNAAEVPTSTTVVRDDAGPQGSGTRDAAGRFAPGPATVGEVRSVLDRRTSVRFFGDRPLAPEGLTAVLRRILDEDADAFPGEAPGGSALELLVAPLRVEGVAPALYAVRAGDATAAGDVGGGVTSDDARRHLAAGAAGAAAASDRLVLDHVAELPVGRYDDLVLQREFAGAAALVFVMGSLRAAEERHGAHGHRLGLVRAGAAAHAGWLHAIETQLTGTVFAGALPTALRGLAGVDGSERTQLFALAVGHPAFG